MVELGLVGTPASDRRTIVKPLYLCSTVWCLFQERYAAAAGGARGPALRGARLQHLQDAERKT